MARVVSYFKDKNKKTNVEEEINGVDVIGDVHGCFDQLKALVFKLGYQEDFSHPEGRKIILLGDVTDRGPNNLKCLEFAFQMRLNGHIWIMGNHDNKIFRYMMGNPVTLSHGAQDTANEIEGTIFKDHMVGRQLMESLPYKVVIEDDHHILHMAHADPLMCSLGKCVYGRLDENNSTRVSWWENLSAKDFPESDKNQTALFGHYWFDDDPVMTKISTKHQWSCLDTSCCDGGNLTAYSYPENTFTTVEGVKCLD